MKNIFLFIFFFSIQYSIAEDIVVYSASQSWNSRIYLMRMDGSVITYYEYAYYIFSDMEAVNNEVYVTDWVAPRLYKLNLNSGSLDIIIDDWNLLSMYDVAFDGTYFYIDEWSLNRYDIYGNWNSNTSFSEAVRGSAWDGNYYWTLVDNDSIKCWDISAWPTITEIPDSAFAPPSSFCRGLWFDENYFWTAESKDGVLGNIYQFDYNGTVINQWLEPAFKGWSAVVVKDSAEIVSIIPVSTRQDETVTITITGHKTTFIQGIDTTNQVWLSQNNFNIWATEITVHSDSIINATFNIPSNTDTGLWHISAKQVNIFGTVTLPNAIQIQQSIINSTNNTIDMIPDQNQLFQNYPNPFNPVTTIEFAVRKDEYVTLKIYNSLGQEVATLVSEKLNAGNHKYRYDASDFSSGIYYYKIEAGNYRNMKKMVLLR